MEDEYFRKITTIILLLVLVALVFIIVRPIIISIIFGILLAFVFTPVYDFFSKHTKMKNLSALIVCLILASAIIIPLWFLTPILIRESFNFFISVQKIDFITPLKEFFPSIFSSPESSAQVGSFISTYVTKAANLLMNSFSNLIIELPQLALQILVILFTFYFVLRDKELLLEYIRSLLPFSKEVEKKLFEYAHGITYSVLYGQIIIGVLQGFIVGASLFLFKVPNAFILTLLAVGFSIIPILGPFFIWIPTVIYLLIGGNNFAGIGVLIFGIIASTIDNILRPFFVSKKVNLPSSIILIGMIGGLLVFGLLGFILGPLILAYFLIFLEIYRNKKIPGIFIEPEKKEEK